MAQKPKKTSGPSMALSVIFVGLMTAIVVPLIGFVIAFSLGSQAGINFFMILLKWAFIITGVVLAYGFAVGLYHTFLSMTGLDKPKGSEGNG